MSYKVDVNCLGFDVVGEIVVVFVVVFIVFCGIDNVYLDWVFVCVRWVCDIRLFFYKYIYFLCRFGLIYLVYLWLCGIWIWCYLFKFFIDELSLNKIVFNIELDVDDYYGCKVFVFYYFILYFCRCLILLIGIEVNIVMYLEEKCVYFIVFILVIRLFF